VVLDSSLEYRPYVGRGGDDIDFIFARNRFGTVLSFLFGGGVGVGGLKLQGHKNEIFHLQ